MIISGRAAFEAVQAMRVESDAVMIGIGTALVDNPRLTVRLAGLAARSPVRIILDAGARLPLDANLVTTAREVPLVVAVGPAAPDERKDALREAGVRLIEVNEAAGGIDLNQLLEMLAAEGFTRVLVEGPFSCIAGRRRSCRRSRHFPCRGGGRPDWRAGARQLRPLGHRAKPALPPNRGRNRRRRPDAPLSQGMTVMFTGIVSEIGTVIGVTERNDVRRIAIACSFRPDSIAIGASIACAGICMTVIGPARRRRRQGGGRVRSRAGNAHHDLGAPMGRRYARQPGALVEDR
jgi:hypothetical protein